MTKIFICKKYTTYTETLELIQVLSKVTRNKLSREKLIPKLLETPEWEQLLS